MLEFIVPRPGAGNKQYCNHLSVCPVPRPAAQTGPAEIMSDGETKTDDDA